MSSEAHPKTTDENAATREAPVTPADVATIVAPSTEGGAQAPSVEIPARYVRGAELGRGGMGVVESWGDPEIGREVAAKVLFRDDPVSRRRFLHEARTQGSLAHPAIVPVYDLAVLADGRPFFTMQRVKGETLASIFAGPPGRFSTRKLLEGLVRMALAVDFAHARGVVHRDLKPANLMLGDFGEVYVLDWGIARRIAERASIVPGGDAAPTTDEVLGLTSAGTLLGTPGYMSPEQARGAIDELDVRADVYALGCVLFEILTGKPLHEGTRVTELVMSALNEGLERSPIKRAPDREIPPELDALCLAATEPSRDARLESVRALAEGLERYLEGDRDVELRMKAAQEHARRAASLANVALGKSRSTQARSDAEILDARKKALADIGRAVALVPEHPVALAALVALLTEPPKRTPDEVTAEIDALRRSHVRVGGRTGALAYGSAAAVLLVVLAAERIPVGPMPIVSELLLLSAAGVSFAFSRAERPARWASMVMMVLSTLALVSLTTLFGPFIATPTALAVNALIFLVSNERALRGPILALGATSVVVPLALEASGLVDPSYRFEDGNLVLLPRALPFEPASVVVLGAVFVATVVLGLVSLGPFRDDLDRALVESRVLAWQLRQFVPTASKKKDPPA